VEKLETKDTVDIVLERQQKNGEPLSIDQVNTEGRIRKDLGDIDALCNSIIKHQLIQPIVIERTSLILVAGGRRITALNRLGIKELIHAVHYIWRDEEDALRRRSVELEENLQRKDLSWQEQLEGKRLLLETLQQIHGAVIPGKQPQTNSALAAHGVTENSFGVVKLAAVLGESPATTSRDLTIANAIKEMPILKQSDTKEAAFRRMRMFNSVVGMALAAQAKKEQNKLLGSGEPQQSWTLFEGDFRDYVHQISDESVDLIHTDLPYGASVEKMSSHSGQLGFDDSRGAATSILTDVARESFRILRQNRYACFWFGFNYYPELVVSLRLAGFSISPVPVIWVKNTKSGENPNSRYSNGYEAFIVAIKGSPILMRPGASNVKTFPVVPSKDKLHVAEKPVDLVVDIIKDLVAPGAGVVDFCAGTGSTAVAAERCKCTSVLFELDPMFCKIIRNKLEVTKP